MKRLIRALRPHLPINTNRYGDPVLPFDAPSWEPTDVRTMRRGKDTR